MLETVAGYDVVGVAHSGNDGLRTDSYFLGGDFNAERCENTGYPEGVNCNQQRWWQVLRFGNGFVDSVFRVHGVTPRDNDPDRQRELNHQYKDGNGRRGKRIDFLWAKGVNEIRRASHDLTCGLPGDNCDRLDRPERYSDHRLVWSTVQLGGDA